MLYANIVAVNTRILGHSKKSGGYDIKTEEPVQIIYKAQHFQCEFQMIEVNVAERPCFANTFYYKIGGFRSTVISNREALRRHETAASSLFRVS